jgi:hypothetical protein
VNEVVPWINAASLGQVNAIGGDSVSSVCASVMERMVCAARLPLLPPSLTEAYRPIRCALLMNYLDRVIFSAGYLLFIAFMLWQVMASLRS